MDQVPKENYDSLRRLHEATNSAVELLQKENDKLQKEVESFKAQTENAENNLSVQKKIVLDHLTQTATKENQLIAQIMELQEEKKILKTRIKELEG